MDTEKKHLDTDIAILNPQNEPGISKKIQAMVATLLKRTPVSSKTKASTRLLSEEEIRTRCIQLKKIQENPNISEKVKKLLLGADVVGVLMGCKPASYIQPQVFKFIHQRNGISQSDIVQFTEILQLFDIELYILGADDPGAKKFKKECGVELMVIYNTKNLLDSLSISNMFSDDELELAKKNPNAFFEYMKASEIGYAKTYRIGIAYGYAQEDVQDMIQEHILNEKYIKMGVSPDEIKNKDTTSTLFSTEDRKFFERIKRDRYTVQIKGRVGSINWQGSNPESLDAQKAILAMKRVFEIQNEVLGSD